MWNGRLFSARLAAFALVAAVAMISPARAQTNFDRPGGDYLRAPSLSGDPAECALLCEHDKHCRAWSFNYPSDGSEDAICLLKNTVPPRVENYCCVSGVRGAGVIEPRNAAIESSIDRFGGDYHSFELKSGEGDDACKTACTSDDKCRAWSYARPGYAGKAAHCFLKKEIKPPRRKPGYISGVVR